MVTPPDWNQGDSLGRRRDLTPFTKSGRGAGSRRSRARCARQLLKLAYELFETGDIDRKPAAIENGQQMGGLSTGPGGRAISWPMPASSAKEMAAARAI